MVSVQAEALNVIDYLFLGLILLSGIIGFVRGFVLEFFGICVWILSFIGAKFLFPHINPLLTEYISHDTLLSATSWFVAYICAFIIFTIIKHLATFTIKGSKPSGLDRLIGFPFGLVRGFVISVVLVFTFSLFLIDEKPEYLGESRCYPILGRTVTFLFSYLGVTHADIKAGVENVAKETINSSEESYANELEKTEKQVEVFSNPIPKHTDE